MSNANIMIIDLIVQLIKKIFLLKMSYFRPYGHRKNKIEVEQICLIMQQNLTQEMQQVLIHHNLLKNMISLT